MAEEPQEFDAERAAELIHARYIDETEQVMPDLGTRPRCCDEKNHREDDPSARPNPTTVIRKGDIILLDRHSAEGRADFEIVKAPAKKASQDDQDDS